MRRLTAKIMITAVAVLGVLGVGVALAASSGSGTCPYGNTPQAGKVAPAKAADQTRDRLRKRDGTGPRHQQMSARRDTRGANGQGAGPGNRGADCPYRS